MPQTLFTCFVDFSKAFDSVNYWKLFNKLLDDKIDVKIVTILMYWYTKQEVCVRTLSSFFTIGTVTGHVKVVSYLHICLVDTFVNYELI